MHFAGSVSAGIRIRAPVRIQTHRIERRIDNPEAVLLRQDGILPSNSRFDVVHALDDRYAGAKAQVCQPAILADGVGLETRNEIGERIGARVIIELILPAKPPNVNTVFAFSKCVQVGAMLNVLIFET